MSLSAALPMVSRRVKGNDGSLLGSGNYNKPTTHCVPPVYLVEGEKTAFNYKSEKNRKKYNFLQKISKKPRIQRIERI
jgi:hypothetical protein